MAKDLLFKIKGDNKQFKESLKEAQSSAGNLSSMLSSGIGMGVGIGGITSAMGLGKELISGAIDATINRESQLARLKQTFAGDSDAAKEAMDGLIKLADKGGVKVDDLVTSFTDLQAKGFDPTMASMQQIGDLAAYFGNDMTTMGEQIEKASLGNLRAFKSMGIELEHVKNKKSGINDLKLTFHGVTTEISDSAEAIKKYLLGLDNVAGVKGAMEALGDTASGSINNMKNAWDEFMISLGGSDGTIKTIIDDLTSFVNKAEEFFKSDKQKQDEAKVNLNEILNATIKKDLNPSGKEKPKTESEIMSDLRSVLKEQGELAQVGIKQSTEALNEISWIEKIPGVKSSDTQVAEGLIELNNNRAIEVMNLSRKDNALLDFLHKGIKQYTPEKKTNEPIAPAPAPTPPSKEEKVKENITINIAKFADSYNVHTVNLKEGVEEIKEIISLSFEEMLSSVKIAGK